jgi:hypothetical protein
VFQSIPAVFSIAYFALRPIVIERGVSNIQSLLVLIGFKNRSYQDKRAQYRYIYIHYIRSKLAIQGKFTKLYKLP